MPKDVECGNGNTLHTIELEGADSAEEKVPIVLCHGFGLGIGAWTYNYAYLQKGFSRVFAIDWLGCGGSSRPKFTPKGDKEAEAWFIDSLDKWREHSKLDKMILCGHSLGGYLSVAYAEKYPQHIHRLVLCGPVGIPEPPEGHDDLSSMPWKFRMLFGSVRSLWSWGVTPQQLVRAAGPWGKGITEKYVQRRVRDNIIDKDKMSDYLYHISAAPGSGEHALSEILLPGAWVRKRETAVQTKKKRGEMKRGFHFMTVAVSIDDFYSSRRRTLCAIEYRQ